MASPAAATTAILMIFFMVIDALLLYEWRVLRPQLQVRESDAQILRLPRTQPPADADCLDYQSSTAISRRKGPNQPDLGHVELNGHVAVRTLLARHSDIVPVGAAGTANLLRAKG